LGTRDELQQREEQASILEDLRDEVGAETTDGAIQSAVARLRDHFDGRGARSPFEYDEATGQFTAVDNDFLAFVKIARNIRSLPKRSREFELGVWNRLKLRITGELHRVGDPRDLKKKQHDFNQHLETLGFNGQVLMGKERDGGFDILWVLPLGADPHRPIVSIQCKNGEFDVGEADKSIGAGSRSFTRHRGLQPGVHVPCVLFNDYISPALLKTTKQFNFVPLGISDLSSAQRALVSHAI
jgi:hypothetical protein